MKLSEIEQLELIDRYLSGKLKGQDLIEFKAKMLSDESFNQIIDFQRLANEMIFDAGLLETKIKIQEAHQRYIANQNKLSRSSRPSKWATIGSIAAISFLFSTEPTGKITLKTSVLPMEHRESIALSENAKTNTVVSSTTKQTIEVIQLEPIESKQPDAFQTEKPQESIQESTQTKNTLPTQVSTEVAVEPAIVKPEEPTQSPTLTPSQKIDTPPAVENTQVSQSPEKVVAPCNLEKSSLSYTTTASCEDRHDGAIQIKAKGIRSAEFSIDGGKTFSKSSLFPSLSPGKYPVTVKAEGGCLIDGDLVEVLVSNSGECLPVAYHFNPELGESWNIPLPSPAVLVVYNKVGVPVFRRELVGFNYEWRGVDDANRALPTGAYLYHVKYNSGKEFKGEIFISR